MKKGTWVVIVLVLTSLLLMVGCGGDERETAPTATKAAVGPAKPTVTTKPTVEPAKKPAGDWEDMPSYPGAKSIGEWAFEFPGGAIVGDYERAEWRYYETKDAPDKVSSFYKTEMLNNGWVQQMWVSATEGMAWGVYTKNDEEEAAIVFVVRGEGEDVTMLGLWGASGKQ